MKSIIHFLIAGLLVTAISCQRTEEPVAPSNNSEDQFFNLKVGSNWVYKTYYNSDFTAPNNPYAYIGRIDSVSIVGTVTVQGLTFAKERTKITYPNSNMNGQVIYNYLRVNSKGHLVCYPTLENVTVTETGGHVLHPGKDFEYSYSSEVKMGPETVGNLFHKLEKNKTISVEGAQYGASPYEGKFTPVPAMPYLLPKTQEISYAGGLGKVREICHEIYGKGFLETRLISTNIIN